MDAFGEGAYIAERREAIDDICKGLGLGFVRFNYGMAPFPEAGNAAIDADSLRSSSFREGEQARIRKGVGVEFRRLRCA